MNKKTRRLAMFINWMVDVYLSRWFVSREDYDRLQFDRWYYEERIKNAVNELHEVLDQTYSRMGYQTIADDLCSVSEIIKTERIDLQAFDYIVRVPQRHFYTLGLSASRIIKENMLERFTRAFREHLRTTFFNLEANKGAQTRSDKCPSLFLNEKRNEDLGTKTPIPQKNFTRGNRQNSMSKYEILSIISILGIINALCMVQIGGRNYPDSHPVAAMLILSYLFTSIICFLWFFIKSILNVDAN